MVRNIWLTGTAYRMRHSVTDRPRHGKAWWVDSFDPDSLRTRKASSPVLSLENFAASRLNSCFLLLIVWFVVLCQLLNSRLFFFIFFIEWYQYYPGVSTICSKNLISREENGCKSCTGQLNIEHFVDLLLMLCFDYWVI